ncbi:MAG TPA: hypothetical protein VJN01_08850, partial [Xanthomonadales bacterium]|nr:hypothetical protein [Xanthomonadales bacterium]
MSPNVSTLQFSVALLALQFTCMASAETGPCEELASQTFAQISIESAAPVHGKQPLPDYCAVRGTIAPTIGF